MPHKELDADILWTNDLEALQITSKLQSVPIQEEYKNRKTSSKKRTRNIYFVPVCAKGKNFFLYNEQTLHEKGKKIEDLESFESMIESHISYYHSHDLDYIYPFIKDGFIVQDKRKQENYPDKEIFSVQIDHYKKLYHDAHFMDDIYLQPTSFSMIPIHVDCLTVKYLSKIQNHINSKNFIICQCPHGMINNFTLLV